MQQFETASEVGAVNPFLGTSLAIRQLADRAQKLLMADSPILIQGETGSGKGILARWLHRNGIRQKHPFVEINCAAIAKELMESELFGHKRGSFTGAVSTKVGLFEAANSGAIFLDELGDMDVALQPKLLKVIEEKRFRRLGDIQERSVDVRIIAATHKNLGQLVKENKFRIDLYFRVNTLPLVLPPLRERVEDIPIVAKHLLEGIAAELGHEELRLPSKTIEALKAHLWPGNIRELRNVLQRAALLTDSDYIEKQDLQFDSITSATDDIANGIPTLLEIERDHIEKVLRVERGQVQRSAERLGLSRSALYEKLKKHSISLSGVQEQIS